MASNTGKKLFLVDGSALAYRSFYAFIKNPLINSRGEDTSTVFGFLRGLFRIEDDDAPDYLAIVFDTREPTFRHKAYAAYKATRDKMPEEMANQLPRLREMLEAMRIPVLEQPGYEADDVLATLALRAKDAGIRTYIATADKDMMQIVCPEISIYNLRRSGNDVEVFDPEGVLAKMGVPPERIIDYLALIGDTSDNVPGVPKIGPKTAVKLLESYGDLDGVLSNIDSIKQNAVRASLQENAELATLSRDLVTLDTNAPVELDLDALSRQQPDADRTIALLKELEFTSLVQRFLPAVEAAPVTYHTVDDAAGLQALIDAIRNAGNCTFDLETTSQFPTLAEIVGFSFAVDAGEAWYVPVAAPEDESERFETLLMPVSDGTKIDLRQDLVPLLENEKIGKNGQNAKYDMLVLANYGVAVAGLRSDTMLASYLLNPTGRQHNLDALALEHFNMEKIPTSDLIGKGKNQITMRDVPMEQVAEYACEDAEVTERLRRLFMPRLEQSGLLPLFQDVEIPLVSVLVHMEHAGVALDTNFLAEMSASLAGKLEELETQIFALSGEPFNINSTQQLGKILFEKLELPVVKRTKTGYSTDASVLEKLAELHDLPARLVEYREITKLKGTYVDALPKLVNPHTGRVHTSYNQTVAATGRLSSSDPNLQNIPIRTEAGRRIRRAFVPSEPGWQILDADYSQIELRIMAHLSGDENLQHAFRENLDIHRTTAAQVFGGEPESVSADLRRRAKEINFGIMYGMGVYGLASRLHIPREEAQDIITSYFAKYPGVDAYIKNTLAAAAETGYVTTLLNRRRLLPDIRSDNRRNREFAERIAINTPIQGTAADMIKLAMINTLARMNRERLKSRMIMQVHDELVFDVPEDELDHMRTLVREEMEGALKLDVPIKVDMGVGGNWLDAH